MARKLAGHIIEDKDWLIMLGDCNSGKGVLQEAFIQTFEKYIGMFNTSVLLTKPTGYIRRIISVFVQYQSLYSNIIQTNYNT